MIKPLAMTIGNFDGVHLGHQSLLKEIVTWAHLHQGISMVFTFNPHPVQVLYPEKKHVRLFDYEDQKEQLKQRGVSEIYVQPFSREFSEQSAECFFKKYLLSQFRVKFNLQFLVIGYDFHFGKNKEGSHQILEKLCREEEVELKIVPPYKLSDLEGGLIVSTSAIRQALSDGNVQLAKKMLGRFYYLKGIVEHGDERGRQLGFPTANVRPYVDFYPRLGVYATWCWINGAKVKSVTNIGYNKTFIDGDFHPIKIETHILDQKMDLYGHEIRVELVKYLREEKKFSSIDELKKQIFQDCKEAFAIFLKN